MKIMVFAFMDINGESVAIGSGRPQPAICERRPRYCAARSPERIALRCGGGRWGGGAPPALTPALPRAGRLGLPAGGGLCCYFVDRYYYYFFFLRRR